jgi:hypothetical protein
MNTSIFEEYTKKNYIPDSVYMICGEQTQDCGICSNNLYSPVVSGMVHDTLRGKVLCPFGKGESMNQPIFGDQGITNATSIQTNPGWSKTTWGHVPQMDPRSLVKIGLSWRTS